ncbi:MAG: sugar-binding domain-containing protein, partial [Christiangramia sp.]
MKFFKYLPVLLFLFSSTVNSQRLVKTLNSGWDFHLENSETIKTVNIPHTWNAEDAFEENDGYYRGNGVYKRQLVAPESWKDKSIFLKFEGANQETKVFINDELVGQHIGGYTAFVFDISEYLNFGTSNTIRIEVDNAYNPDIPPLEADFNFYGGIYRDLQVIVTGKSHFKMEGETAGNLLVKTPEVSREKAEINFSGEVENSGNRKLKLQIKLTDPSGNKVSEHKKTLNSGKFSVDFKIKDPKLWSPDSPELYQISASLTNSESGEITDIYSTKFGCRWFEA